MKIKTFDLKSAMVINNQEAHALECLKHFGWHLDCRLSGPAGGEALLTLQVSKQQFVDMSANKEMSLHNGPNKGEN